MLLPPSVETEVGVREPRPSSPAPSPAPSFLRGLSQEETGKMVGEGGALIRERSFPGLATDPAKCSALSLEEKRRIVHEISQSPDDAAEFLQSWTRRELLQLICAEMGEERKYTGLTKPKMIERLLKLVLQKNSGKEYDDTLPNRSMSDKTYSIAKKKRKTDQQQLATEYVPVPSNESENEGDSNLLCKNLACQAALGPKDAFCKRCSCCICYRYDDNKDPSLWLVCNSDPPFQGNSCGLSCHLKCALKDERAGITRNGCHEKLDGGFYCVCCKKVNGLIGSLRKQLSIAKDARRVDVLCYRIFLSHQILKGTEQYKDLETIVHTAAKKLKKEVGPLDKVSAMMARGIVNRLACGAEIQKLCAIAIEDADFLLLDQLPDADVKIPTPPSCRIKFEDLSPVSVIISLASDHMIFEDVVMGYRLWHRKSCSADYSEEPTCVLLRPNTKIMVSGLSPSTEYYFKVSPFSSSGELGMWEAALITKSNGDCNNFASHNSGSMVEFGGFDEEKTRGEQLTTTQTNSQRGSTSSSDSPQEARHSRIDCKSHSRVLSLEDIGDNSVKHSVPTNDAPFGRSNSAPLETPTKSDAPNNSLPDSTDKSESAERQYEYCVKVIRWLECEGHMEKEFRVKFLTWFSLKATVQERRVVSAFIDVLIDEPASLVDQLIDAFMDGICNKEKMDDTCNGKQVVKNRLCTRLWH